MENLFIPEDFAIPDHLQTDQFSFVVLEPSLAEEDFEAFMSSKERLRHVFSEDDQWPADSMTLELNIQDLLRHETEFNNRQAFAYSVLSAAKDNT